jgi:hypothetical protein
MNDKLREAARLADYLTTAANQVEADRRIDYVRLTVKETREIAAALASPPANALRNAAQAVVAAQDRHGWSPVVGDSIHALRLVLASPPEQAGAQAAVLAAASQWWCEREITDWDEAALAKAVIELDGDWEGCPDCDHATCDMPCTPATVSEQIRAVDRHIAQLVHDGKLHAGADYKAPDGWLPMLMPRKRAAPSPSAPLDQQRVPRAHFDKFLRCWEYGGALRMPDIWEAYQAGWIDCERPHPAGRASGVAVKAYSCADRAAGKPKCSKWCRQAARCVADFEFMDGSEYVGNAAQPPQAPPAAPEQIKRWCETCDGVGTIDERLGGYAFSDPAAKCPDCDGNGWWIAAAPAAPETGVALLDQQAASLAGKGK